MGVFSDLGVNIAGDMLGDANDMWGTGYHLRQQVNKENWRYAQRAAALAYENQMKAEREGIQSRVEGFKAAGLHPALAAGAGASSPGAVTVGSFAAPARFRSASGGGDPYQLDPSQVRLNNAQAESIELSNAASLRNLAVQPGNPPVTGIPHGGVNFVKDQPISKNPDNPALTAGVHAGATEVDLPIIGRVPIIGGVEALQESPVSSVAMGLLIKLLNPTVDRGRGAGKVAYPGSAAATESQAREEVPSYYRN